jgi:hypothetical protein
MAKYERKEQHLPDTCLQTAAQHRESSENLKNRAFSQHCGFHQLELSLYLQLMKATMLSESSVFSIFSRLSWSAA